MPDRAAAAVRGEEEVMAEFQRRVRPWGGAFALAVESGSSPAMISRIRAGRSRVNVRVARALGFDLVYAPRADLEERP
jgi:hypothetical protein